MRACSAWMVLVMAMAVVMRVDAAEKPLGPVEAREQVGKKVTVVLTVRVAKDRLEKHGEIYLDSEEDFKDEKNFALVITRAGAKSLRAAGIAAPVKHFNGKKVRASGTVKEVNDIPRIEIDEAKQIQLLDGK